MAFTSNARRRRRLYRINGLGYRADSHLAAALQHVAATAPPESERWLLCTGHPEPSRVAWHSGRIARDGRFSVDDFETTCRPTAADVVSADRWDIINANFVQPAFGGNLGKGA